MKTMVATVCAVLLATLCLAQDGSGPKPPAVITKANAIIIPDIRFSEAKVADVVQFLARAAKENDAEKTGVNLVLMDSQNKSKITINLHKVSLHRALKLVAEMAGLAINVEDDIIVLRKHQIEKK